MQISRPDLFPASTDFCARKQARFTELENGGHRLTNMAPCGTKRVKIQTEAIGASTEAAMSGEAVIKSFTPSTCQSSKYRKQHDSQPKEAGNKSKRCKQTMPIPRQQTHQKHRHHQTGPNWPNAFTPGRAVRIGRPPKNHA